jgi:hypothetical protein
MSRIARRSSRPPAPPSPQGVESVLALVALGRVDASTAPLYRRALRHLGESGLVDRDPVTGAWRVSSHPTAALTPVPPAPPLETLVTRVPVEVLSDLDMHVAARPGATRSEVAREALALGLAALAKRGSGVRKAAG